MNKRWNLCIPGGKMIKYFHELSDEEFEKLKKTKIPQWWGIFVFVIHFESRNSPSPLTF